MKKYCFLVVIVSTLCFGQDPVGDLIDAEYKNGHFNGTALVVKDKKVISNINRGFANFQFKVRIDSCTRFPIASITKLFTTVAILQLQERSVIDLNDKISKYIEGLPANCQNIHISDLLIHHSGLSNEPVRAYLSKYKIDRYIKEFVFRKDTAGPAKFNYNNVDFVLLSGIIEKATQKTFSEVIESQILIPLKLDNTGFVNESDIILNLAYGYHNYSFGKGGANDPLYNDRRFLSNYFGAGQMYSTTEDLYRFIMALGNDKLISEQTRRAYLIKPQKENRIDGLQGMPTYGFYFDDKTYGHPVLRRGGSIDGFNTEIITDMNFNKIVIILCNTDTGDLKEISNKIFSLVN
ncbi:serine hydrolase [Sinomicrobium sp. FJxs]|uniref:Serine hydrolase n=2 Tax=Sinomicrobium weinanense TaxID=2842200 RepID=A0A926JVD4_9FLAO|nr:serine hydrolase domain-containing protein [Sinomicrobium weinanense]MBC9798064.1 serine hydrolase [Sinomicrobium weinanense]MBU3122523.1 beta-lactamase family protein [Sinomicrobium weinanense]